MKYIFSLLFSLLLLAGFSQSKELELRIENVEALYSAPTDSIGISLTNQGFIFGENVRKIPTNIEDDTITLTEKIVLRTDSTALRIYFNNHGFIEILNLYEIEADNLTIKEFPVFPDCNQIKTEFRKTVFENTISGKRDEQNHQIEIKSEVQPSDEECTVPDSLSISINGVEYRPKIETDEQLFSVKSGQGKTRKFLFGEKKDFYFEELKFYIIRKTKILVN